MIKKFLKIFVFLSFLFQTLFSQYSFIYSDKILINKKEIKSEEILIKNNKLMAPLEETLFTTLGAKYSKNATSVTIKKDNQVIKINFKNDKIETLHNGKLVNFYSPPYFENGKIIIPLGDFYRLLGFEVSFEKGNIQKKKEIKESEIVKIEGKGIINLTEFKVKGKIEVKKPDIEEKPKIKIETKEDLINTKRPLIRGKVSGENTKIKGISWTIDGIKWFEAKPSDGKYDEIEEEFEIEPYLEKDGNYKIVVKAENIAGNFSEEIYEFTVDTTPPFLFLTTKYDGQIIDKKEIEIKGKVEKGAEVFINDLKIEVSQDEFRKKIKTVKGENKIKIIARDRAGNKTEEILKFRRVDKKRNNIKYYLLGIIGIGIISGFEGGGGKKETGISGYGKIYVESFPSDAKIYLDNKETGLTTPSELSNVPAGKHRIKLTKEGYEDWIKDIEVIANETTNILAGEAILILKETPGDGIPDIPFKEKVRL
jgi:hypothetical protein